MWRRHPARCLPKFCFECRNLRGRSNAAGAPRNSRTLSLWKTSHEWERDESTRAVPRSSAVGPNTVASNRHGHHSLLVAFTRDRSSDSKPRPGLDRDYTFQSYSVHHSAMREDRHCGSVCYSITPALLPHHSEIVPVPRPAATSGPHAYAGVRQPAKDHYFLAYTVGSSHITRRRRDLPISHRGDWGDQAETRSGWSPYGPILRACLQSVWLPDASTKEDSRWTRLIGRWESDIKVYVSRGPSTPRRGSVSVPKPQQVREMGRA